MFSNHSKHADKQHVADFTEHGVISGFRCDVAENCTVLRYYASSGGKSSPIFQDNLSVTFEDVLDSLSRIVRTKLTLLAAQ